MALSEEKISLLAEDAISHEELQNVSNIITSIIHKYDSEIEEHDIVRIINNKTIDHQKLRSMLEEPNCQSLASSFSILGIDNTTWNKVYNDLKSHSQLLSTTEMIALNNSNNVNGNTFNTELNWDLICNTLDANQFFDQQDHKTIMHDLFVKHCEEEEGK